MKAFLRLKNLFQEIDNFKENLKDHGLEEKREEDHNDGGLLSTLDNIPKIGHTKVPLHYLSLFP